MRGYILCLVLLSTMIISLHASAASIVGTSSIRAPAVIINNNTGSLTNISLTITPGNGTVRVIGPQVVGSSTTQSAEQAALYASNYTNHDFPQYDFNYTIQDANNVSGPSAGAAMTILAVSAFENKPLRTDFTMTGTISGNGSIGEIGGVYDKVAAAKNAGIQIVLVPAVQQGSAEGELYYLVQTNFQIPLVQVANISQAAHFAFNSSINGEQNLTTYNFYTNYNVSKIPQANLNCSASCNGTLFNLLLNETFNLTRSEINNLGSNQKFAGVAYQLGRVLNQSISVASLGYRYTGADLAFLDYVNAYYFAGYPSTRTGALAQLNSVKSFCTSLNPPQLTESNYNYVVNAEMRQYWGNYTISTALTSYNSSSIDSDQILDELYLGAQANGWCTASNLIYSDAIQQNTSSYLAPSSSLSSVASQRLNRALPYGTSLYLVTAELAYKQGNYPVAILDADYAYALANASRTQLNTQQLDLLSGSIAQNSTYGVWATEFAKEALFYVNESQLTNNATLAKSYSESAYTTALLAEQISNDTRVIRQNLVAVEPSQVQSAQLTENLTYITYSQELIFALLTIVIVMLIINTMLVIVVMHRQKRSQPKQENNAKRKRRK